jgi:hypothetical protein
MSEKNEVEFTYRGDRLIRDAAVAVFAVLIALLGAAMMATTSSPLAKGAAFLWLPAALQLIAGVWLGPIRGFFAGAIGAQVAGIIAYGGWGLPDWIQNFLAGGLANSLLPGLLFRFFRIDPKLGAKADALGRASLVILAVTIIAVIVAFVLFQLGFSKWFGYFPPMLILLFTVYYWKPAASDRGQYFPALWIAVFSCLISAVIGTAGNVVAGQSWGAAILGTGIGWFLGDTASSILGLYMLAQFTERAQINGLAPILTITRDAEKGR